MTLGHSDDIDHLILSEHLADSHLLLKVVPGKGNLGVEQSLNDKVLTKIT